MQGPITRLVSDRLERGSSRDPLPLVSSVAWTLSHISDDDERLVSTMHTETENQTRKKEY